MSDEFLTIKTGVEHELVIRRSRFVAALVPADSDEAARAFIAERRRAHWNAAHNCTAFVLGANRDVQRSNDDGEPSGTAGVPMLEALQRRELTNVVAVVTRYFGGVKLGAGGLIRAYGGAVHEAAQHARIVTWRAQQSVVVQAPHTAAGRLEHDLRAGGYPVRDVTYEHQVWLTVTVDPADVEVFASWIHELTNGAAHTTPGAIDFYRV